MAVNMQTFTSDGHHAIGRLGQLFVSFARNTRVKSKTALKALQMARMMSTLANMSDNQLAHIGISRADIPDYAKTLLADE